MDENKKKMMGFVVAMAVILALIPILEKEAQMSQRHSERQKPTSGAEKAAPEAISAEMPYESRYIEVLGSKIHYVEGGQGDPILFLHGNPTSSYLWRNIMPHLEAQGRVIAMDLIGMGQSEKPDIGYRFFDHYAYVEGFIEAMELENITLVIHDWGSALGFHYASSHEENIKGIAFMEAIIPSAFLEQVPPEGSLFYQLRHPEIGPRLVLEENFFVESVLPSAVMRTLTDEEMDRYRAPYPSPESRKPTLVWPNEVPFADGPEDNAEMVRDIGQWLERSELPFLFVWVRPGVLNPVGTAERLAASMKNIETQYVGEGIHFLQEDHPHEIGRAISEWYGRLDGG